MNNKTQEAFKMAIEKAMIPNTKAIQQSQSNPVFLAQGSKLVAGHEGVFVEDKNLKQQKQWQGLSDEEIWDIANFLGKNKEWDYPVMFAKTIEKVLKEKNT